MKNSNEIKVSNFSEHVALENPIKVDIMKLLSPEDYE